MLRITIPSIELFDEKNNEFLEIKQTDLQLEHSLVSLSKWESKWKKPFLSKETRTIEETIDYIRCMTITQNVDPLVYRAITPDIIDQINRYISDPMTATTIREDKRPFNRDIITAEIIYYWMITLNIPFECQKWHLNRLLTLINVCSIKNSPQKKMSKREIMSRNASLNAARKRALSTRG
jgi:hypothetical protein